MAAPGVKRQREMEPGEVSIVPKLVRTNRLFGNLVSHLGRAKREGEETLQKKVEEQSSKKRLTEVPEEKKKEQPNATQSASKHVAPPEKAQMMSEVLLKKQMAEAEKQLSAFEAEYSPRSRFLVTEIEPRLLWLPGKHSASTEAELQSRRADFESVFAKKKEQTQEKVAELEQRLREIQRPEQVDQSKDGP